MNFWFWFFFFVVINTRLDVNNLLIEFFFFLNNGTIWRSISDQSNRCLCVSNICNEWMNGSRILFNRENWVNFFSSSSLLLNLCFVNYYQYTTDIYRNYYCYCYYHGSTSDLIDIIINIYNSHHSVTLLVYGYTLTYTHFIIDVSVIIYIINTYTNTILTINSIAFGLFFFWMNE